jgi:hypothetical protein
MGHPAFVAGEVSWSSLRETTLSRRTSVLGYSQPKLSKLREDTVFPRVFC